MSGVVAAGASDRVRISPRARFAAWLVVRWEEPSTHKGGVRADRGGQRFTGLTGVTAHGCV